MDREYPFNAGWANGWSETPEIIKKCQEAGHETIEHKGQWNCTWVVKCPICGYSYMYDSSG